MSAALDCVGGEATRAVTASLTLHVRIGRLSSDFEGLGCIAQVGRGYQQLWTVWEERPPEQ